MKDTSTFLLHRLRLAPLIFCGVLWISWLGSVQAQAQSVQGKVVSKEEGEPLPGVNVIVKGTTIGTVTNMDGEYRISVTEPEAVLQFSFIGYVSEEVPVNGRSTVDIALTDDLQQLSEVVVTGYGTRSTEGFTGSMGSVGADKIQNKPLATVDQALQGSVPGVQLSATSGTPGAAQDIRIRGISSITADNDPLFVIDGIPVTNASDINRSTATGSLSPLSALSPNDIASITVLKDASATALYGARGANGVIIVTTKSGSQGKPSISFSAQTGVVSRAVPGPQMLNSAQWDELYYEGLVNAGSYPTVEAARADDDNGWDGTTDTDWRDVVSRDNARTSTYDVSLRGGSEASNYYASLGYFTQDGVSVGSDYERYSGKFNYDTRVSDKINLTSNTTASYVVQNGQLEGSAYFGSPTAAILFAWPIDNPINPDGTYNLDNISTSTFNPLYLAANNVTRRKQTRILNSTALGYEIAEGLRFTSTLGLDFLVTEELYYRNGTHGDGAPQNGTSTAYTNRNFNYDWKNMLDYSLRLNEDNKFDFKLVYEAQRNNYYTVGAGGYGFASDGLIYPETVGTPDFSSGYATDWAINSFLGVVNYTFRGNLFVDGTFRREGNSRFAPDNRWGSFYSLGASWVFSDEAFMKDMTWLNTSKIRASYGKTGNAAIDLNQYQALLSYSSILNSSDGTYNGLPAISPSQFGNANLTWENNESYNFGLDFGVFERLTGSVDYFHRRTYDLLLDVPLSYTTGFEEQTQNVGEMINNGWEVSLNGALVETEAFRWSLGANFTAVKNRVTSLPRSPEGEEIGINESTRIVTEGESVYSWYLPVWAGVNADTGEPLWYTDGEGSETTSNYAEAQQVVIGPRAPTFYGGLNTRLDFKGIYLTANLYYSTGNYVYDTWGGYTQSDGRFTYSVSNGYARQFDRWQQPGDISPNPQNIAGNTSNSNSASTRRLYNDEFLRLKDVTLGYNLPPSLLEPLGIQSVNIYLKGNNIWTWVADDALEFDPEVQAEGDLDLFAPPLKTYAAGIIVSF